jgi:hypothetical protein
MDIHEAYEVYQRLTCHYEDLQRASEIFTDDFVGGNSTAGQLRGLKAQKILLNSAIEMGLKPEDHLWSIVDGANLTFRFRQWAGTKYDSAFFDGVGHLVFDELRGKFCYYHGFFDARTAIDVLRTSATCSLSVAAKGMQAAKQATDEFLAREESESELPDAFKVSSGI